MSTDREVYEVLQNRLLARHDKPFILAFAAIVVTLLIVSLILYFFRAV